MHTRRIIFSMMGILPVMACEMGLTVKDPSALDGITESEPSVDSQPSSEPSGSPSSEPTSEPSGTNSDQDGDGYDSSIDCNDYNPSVHPGAVDTPDDGIDQDCNGVDSTSSNSNDVDGDGYPNTNDCNDYNPSVNPGAYDVPNDGIDQDCSGTDAGGSSSNDVDGDGYPNTTDCNDYNASIHPGAYDVPNNGIDEDCSGSDAGGSSSGGGNYTGWENFKMALAGWSPGSYDCNMNFTLSGTPSSVSCSNCTYTFDMTITYSASGSVASSDCSTLTQTMVVPYGFVNNYNGTGQQALLLYDTGSWVVFAENGNVSYNMVDTVSFTSSQFSYSMGYLDYYAYSTTYGYGYFTNRWTGGGSR